VKPYYDHGGITIYHGDCLEILPEVVADESVDLVLTDPPYGKVAKADFDHAWTNREKFLHACPAWIDAIVGAIKPNGTLFWFAWPSLAGRIEARIAERMNILAHIVWVKPGPRTQKVRAESLRAPIPESERIIMAERFGADSFALGESAWAKKCDECRSFVFEPLRKYLADEFAALGWTSDDLNNICGTASMAGRHYTARSQWCLPTKEHYLKLQRAASYGHLRREYGHLRREYEDLRREYEDLRRYFDCRSGDQKTDIWRFPVEAERCGHPTQKPRGIISYMVRLSCRPNGLVLDPFMGSGTTLRAAKDLGRRAIGIEIEERYCEMAAKRLQQEVLKFEE